MSFEIARIDLYGSWTAFHDEWKRSLFDGEMAPLPRDFLGQLSRFLCEGLPLESLVNAVEVTMEAHHVSKVDKWRYFCGVCISRIRVFKFLAKADHASLNA
ncbi:hypothetical protein acdb102_31060 [Acidothermaceae bacterium B102]|nr:hypothetical protein acdb102_31060 [Acidothermaceae bacterium B102]